MEALLALLSTVAGKAVAGTAIAAASVGGLHAADVVEVPLLPSEAQTDVVTDLPADGAEVSDEASEGKAGAEAEEESDTDEGRQDADVRQDGEERPDADVRQDAESQGIGESVSADAQDGGVEGEDVVAQTPAATKVPAEAFGPEEPGSQAPEQSQAPADAGSQADAEPGTQAGEHRPADAGAEANGRP